MERLLSLCTKVKTLTSIESSFHIGQFVSNVGGQNSIERLGQVGRPTSMGDIAISGMGAEEIRFRFDGFGHGFVGIDVLLTSIDDANEAQFERIDTTSEDIQGIGP